ncbi:MAG: hypothetical protein HWN80_04700 [Candidatus Lokiarchaeota archaeon]|nr:hypothetical protein [Candidatus Lokiarchaeota archaeon]
MGIETEKNRKHETLVIEISEYDRVELVLNKIIIPFSEVLKASSVPDIYFGYEKIPFEKRDPFYKSIMRQEFADAMRSD